MADLDPVASVLVRGPMPLAQSAKIVTRVCELLAPIHDKRRAHGAISPDNVFFRHVGGELTVQLRAKVIPGATYASPERARGRPEGPTSDVYSLGVLFFHMITGQPPFDGGTADEILEQHRTRPPPALGYNELQDIPIELEQIVRGMLAKDPTRRPGVRKIAHDVDNLELDSTVMGIRIQAALEGASDPPDVDTALLQNVKIELEGRTDPQIVDPYADTLIKNRADFGLDDPDGAQDTFLNLSVQKKPTSGWNEDPTKILDHPPADLLSLEASPDEATADEASAESGDLRRTGAMIPAVSEEDPPSSSRLLFGLGLLFFLAALVTLTLVLMR